MQYGTGSQAVTTGPVVFNPRDAAMDLRHENIEIDRFGKVDFGSALQTGQSVFSIGHSRQHDEWRLGELRVVDLDFCQELMPVHHRHGNVTDDNIRPMVHHHVQSLAAIAGFERRHSCIRKLLDEEFTDVGLVIDAQYGDHVFSLLCCLFFGFLFDERNADGERRPFADFALGGDTPAMEFDDFSDNVKSDARTRDTRGATCAEIGLKQPGKVIGVHANAVIRDRYRGSFTVLPASDKNVRGMRPYLTALDNKFDTALSMDWASSAIDAGSLSRSI